MRRDYPFLVVDSWGERPSIGCWFKDSAMALPGRISAPYERGRWVLQQAVSLDG